MPPASCVMVPAAVSPDLLPAVGLSDDLAAVRGFVNAAGGLGSALADVGRRVGRWVLSPDENLRFLRALSPDDFRAVAAMSAARDLENIAADLLAVSSALKLSAGA